MLRLITESEKIKPVAVDTELETDAVETDDVSVELSDAETESIDDVVQSENSTIEEIPTDVIKKACQDSVNGLIQNGWDFISNVNSVIATIEYDYKEANKEALLEILNTAVNDITVVIGMLYSGVNLIDNKTAELIQNGSEKAENLVDNM